MNFFTSEIVGDGTVPMKIYKLHYFHFTKTAERVIRALVEDDTENVMTAMAN